MILQPGAIHAAPDCHALKASYPQKSWGQTNPPGPQALSRLGIKPLMERSKLGCSTSGRHGAGSIPIPVVSSSSTRLLLAVAPETTPANPSQGHLVRLYQFCFLCNPSWEKKSQRLLHKHIPPMFPLPWNIMKYKKKRQTKRRWPRKGSSQQALLTTGTEGLSCSLQCFWLPRHDRNIQFQGQSPAAAGGSPSAWLERCRGIPTAHNS